MKRIALDIDGCLAAFNQAFHRLLRDQGAALAPFPEGGEPAVWDWPEALGATRDQVRAAWDHVEAHPDWWATLMAHVDMTLEHWRQVRDLCLDHEVYFVTSRGRATAATRLWLEVRLYTGHRVPFEVVAVSGPKALALMALQPDIIVEDRLDTLEECERARLDAACILVDRPYNRQKSWLDEVATIAPRALMRVPSTAAALGKVRELTTLPSPATLTP